MLCVRARVCARLHVYYSVLCVCIYTSKCCVHTRVYHRMLCVSLHVHCRMQWVYVMAQGLLVKLHAGPFSCRSPS